MNSTTHSTRLAALGQPGEIGRQFRALLVELIDLSLLGEQLQWSVLGLPFRPLRLQLAGLVDSPGALADTLPERTVAVGAEPDGRSATIEVVRALDGPVWTIRAQFRESGGY
jgi:DNA-binding ferritin-like protein